MDNTKLKILVVEDEPLLLEAIGKKLEIDDIEAVLCIGGKEALQYLESHADMPSAIWLDYYLKDLDGLTFMGKLKQKQKRKKIPVIVVSNSASTQKVNMMLGLGVKKYLLKAEYRLDDIVNIIKELTNQD